nr:serine hydrolase domain-containing protein [Spongiactinospora gelatinilytica]
MFEPGEQLSYSNGGMIVAGRLLEVVTGTPFPDPLERDVYAPIGMKDSCTSAEQAILRSTAIGHFLALVAEVRQDIDLTPYVGTYRSDQLRIDVGIVDGRLEERTTYEPTDESQERIFTEFAGGVTSAPPQRYVPIRPGLFAPAEYPLETFDGYLRLLLVSYHDIRDGRAHFRNGGGRLIRRA